MGVGSTEQACASTKKVCGDVLGQDKKGGGRGFAFCLLLFAFCFLLFKKQWMVLILVGVGLSREYDMVSRFFNEEPAPAPLDHDSMD